MKPFLVAIEIWVLGLVAVFAVPMDLPSATPYVVLFFAAGGLILILAFLIILTASKRKGRPMIAILLVLAICAILFGRIHKWGAQLHLVTNSSLYEMIVSRVASASSDDEREKICGDDCFILSSDPLRVSFHFSHWFLNWNDIVYDPSGAIADPNIDNRHRLNAYLFSGEHLRDDWYLGHFGD